MGFVLHLSLFLLVTNTMVVSKEKQGKGESAKELGALVESYETQRERERKKEGETSWRRNGWLKIGALK